MIITLSNYNVFAIFLKVIEDELRMRDSNFEHGPSSKFQFEKDEIHLKISEDKRDGWSMIRLNPLLVCVVL